MEAGKFPADSCRLDAPKELSSELMTTNESEEDARLR